MRAGVYVACRATCAVCRAMTAPSIRAVPKRVRLDQLLVERGLAPSRERAQALILAGVVRVDGARADRAAAPVRDGSDVAVDPGRRYVSRGGDKLAGALDAFAGDVVALVKPQFEAGRGAVGRGGLVRDPVARADAMLAVARDLAMRGAPVVAVAPSSLAGREGNREIFVHARKGGRGLDDAALAEAARAAAG